MMYYNLTIDMVVVSCLAGYIIPHVLFACIKGYITYTYIVYVNHLYRIRELIHLRIRELFILYT